MVPTTVTLFLAGIWHGAGFQFIVFGLLHAFFLCCNHAWRVWRGTRPAQQKLTGLPAAAAGVGSLLLTYVAVLVAQVFFRARSTRDAVALLGGMLGRHGHLPMPGNFFFYPDAGMLLRIAGGLFIVWAMPNTQQILAPFKPSLHLSPSDLRPGFIRFTWRPAPAWSLAIGILLLFTLVKMQDPSAFLYFQF